MHLVSIYKDRVAQTTYAAGFDSRYEDKHKLVLVHPRADPKDNGCSSCNQGDEGREHQSYAGHKQLGEACQDSEPYDPKSDSYIPC